MNVELVNPFIESAINVLKTMAQTEPTAGKPFVKSDATTWGVVTGVIGMAANEMTGNLVLSFDQPCILSIVSKMLMEEFTELSPDVVDAVGEITNMISGGTKSALSQKGFTFEMSTPMMITGQNVELKQLSKSPILVVPFQTDAGKFVLEANLHRKS